MPSPFSDFLDFLLGNTDDHDALGSWKYLFVVLFFALVFTSVVVAWKNWREDPSQRTGRNLAIWFVRVLVGGMWFQGMLWKLPLPVSGGLKYWLEQMGNRAAFAFHRELVTEFYLPYLHILNPIVFLAELTFAVSLILGFGGSSGQQPCNYFRVASLARHLSAGQSCRMAVVICVPCDRHADVRDRCGRAQPWS